ncbi:hypothetical protein VAR608DRAFT_3531 [Variovorax sp. HW608]|uniref:hypothetical protein n=1 Tax=Variovorax sp. HW608 TaxID=1034889 RepID=UPI00081F89CF|nr:hypothetical protein [Variovorax sp. HW608]SCK38065.1 hypothetical protein VAR608DRAFT_3531 [Variovorax sp. HW608]
MTRDIYVSAAEAAALLREGQQYRHDRLRAADMITVEEAGLIMGVDDSTIAAWIVAGKCIGLGDPDGAMKLPRWQFEPSAWSSIQRIGRSLGTRDCWQIFDFLETPASALGGLTPRVALEQGMPVQRVLAAATAYAH